MVRSRLVNETSHSLSPLPFASARQADELTSDKRAERASRGGGEEDDLSFSSRPIRSLPLEAGEEGEADEEEEEKAEGVPGWTTRKGEEEEDGDAGAAREEEEEGDDRPGVLPVWHTQAPESSEVFCPPWNVAKNFELLTCREEEEKGVREMRTDEVQLLALLVERKKEGTHQSREEGASLYGRHSRRTAQFGVRTNARDVPRVWRQQSELRNIRVHATATQEYTDKGYTWTDLQRSTRWISSRRK